MKRLFFTLICTTALLTIPQQLLLVSPNPVTAQQTTPQLLTTAQLQDLAKSITVKILTKNGSGSGTLIAKNGNNYTVLTNDHVLSPGASYRIQTPDGKIYTATVIKEKPPSLKNQDVALLQFQSTAEYTIASLGISSPIAVEQKIVAAGFVNDNAKLIFTEGKISLLPDKSFQRGYRIGYSNKIQPGMSGGPILNYQGELIGINAVHAYPISDKVYVYSDNTKPSVAERQQMSQYSWGVPIYSVAKGVNEVIAKSPTKVDDSGLIAKKGLINDIDKIAQEITVLVPAADGIGSGVIIAQKGDTYYVLTSDHVVWDNVHEKKFRNKLEIVTPDNQRYAVNVNKINRMPGVDLAVVQFTSNKKYRVATLAKYSLENEKMNVFVSGFPASKQQNKNKPNRILTAGSLMKQERVRLNPYVSFNNQGSLENQPSVQRREVETVLSDGYELLYSNITEGGMSGGAVLDTQGRVIGIHGRVEAEIDNNKLEQINLGRSSGIPISTFLGLVKQVGLASDLKIETTLPATLKKPEEDLISEYLLPLDEVPKDSDDEILWLNYANQLWRSKKYPEARKAVDKAIEKKPDFYQAWYLKGLIFNNEEKYSESIAAFDKAVTINPNFAQAWKLRGRSLLQPNRYSEALASFEKAIALSPNQFDLYYFQGNALRSLKRFPEAIDAYDQAIKIYPHSSVYGGKALVYFNLEDYKKVIENYDDAIRLNPSNAYYYSNRCYAYSSLEEYQKAINDCNQAIRLNSNDSWFYYIRGDVYSNQKYYKQAIADYTQAIYLEPEKAMYYLHRGTTYSYKLNETEKANADYKKVVQIKPKNAFDYQIRGQAYTQLYNHEQAIANYSEAIKLDPKNAEYYFERGNAYAQFNIFKPPSADYKQAIVDYNQAIKLNPTNPFYYYKRGDAYKYLGDDKQAIVDYTQAIYLAPQDPIYYIFRGSYYVKLNKYTQAINDYTQAIKLKPENSEYYEYRINAYRLSEQYEQAIDDYTQIIKLNPKDVSFYVSRAVLYLILKEYKQAIDDYTQVIKLDPENANYYRDRGNSYAALKEYKQAIDDYNQAIKFDPKNADYYYYLRGLANYKLKDYQQAINDLTQAIKIKPEYPEAYRNLGIVHYEMGEVETAISNWRTAVKINSNFAEAHLALGVALYAKGDKEAGLKSGETALKLDKRFGKIEFLKENGWGEKLIKDSQEFLNNPRMKSLI